LTLDGTDYILQGSGNTVQGYVTNTSRTLTPKPSLDANTYNTQLVLTYTYGGTSYTAYANVYMTVDKAAWEVMQKVCYYNWLKMNCSNVILRNWNKHDESHLPGIQ
jgi:hypothetical protein